MKITVLSDLHFGFGYDTELEEDAYEAAKEALEKSSASEADLILLGGDIFDTKIPKNETLVRAMELLMGPLSETPAVKLSEGVGKDITAIPRMALSGTPVIAIHGTHERRAKGLLNPVQMLEKAGFILYLDCNGVVFQKGEEKVCVQGMSGVPDQHTEEALREWGPKPVPGCVNILMLHQNLTEFMHEKVPHTLDISKLPKGFDFYVCGHIHETVKREHGSGLIILPGSLIPTQLTKDFEGAGFWQIDTSAKKVELVSLENQRKIYVREFEASKSGAEAIEKEMAEILKTEQSKKPIIRVKLKGRQTDLPLKSIEAKLGDKCILSFRKDFEKEELPQAKGMEEHKLSVDDMGRKLLRANLKEFKLDEKLFESVFELLLEKKTDDVLTLLSSPVKLKSKALPEPQATISEESKPKEPQKQAVQWKQFLKSA